jgi:hypothetical protein
MKHDLAIIDATDQIRRLKKDLYSAKARAREWRLAAKYQIQVARSSQQILREVQTQRDFLLIHADRRDEEIEELRAYNRVLQWRIDTGSPSPPLPPPNQQLLAQSAQGQQQLSQQEYQQFALQHLGQMQQNVAALQNYSQEQFGQEFCTCVPARHSALIR